MDEYKEFNSSLKTFIRKMIELFPNQKEIKLFLVSYKMTKSIDRKMPSRIFNELILSKNKERILNNDETFILDFVLLCDTLPLPIQMIFADTKKINMLWYSIEQEDKVAIWQHLNNLVMLCEKCVS